MVTQLQPDVRAYLHGAEVIKKFARIGEASIIYSIGRHRFIELARAAGATYKINGGTGGTVLINLELFDEYRKYK